ncbi:MAG TPA: hypothetical protein VKZ82_13035 [Nonomuraea sp.]|nr:hypothetical protein [Nonomuraea sp.]
MPPPTPSTRNLARPCSRRAANRQQATTTATIAPALSSASVVIGTGAVFSAASTANATVPTRIMVSAQPVLRRSRSPRVRSPSRTPTTIPITPAGSTTVTGAIRSAKTWNTAPSASSARPACQRGRRAAARRDGASPETLCCSQVPAVKQHALSRARPMASQVTAPPGLPARPRPA